MLLDVVESAGLALLVLLNDSSGDSYGLLRVSFKGSVGSMDVLIGSWRFCWLSEGSDKENMLQSLYQMHGELWNPGSSVQFCLITLKQSFFCWSAAGSVVCLKVLKDVCRYCRMSVGHLWVL